MRKEAEFKKIIERLKLNQEEKKQATMKCPYCNGDVIIDKEVVNDGNMHYDVTKVCCTVCRLSSKGYTTWYAKSENPIEDALNGWNERVFKLGSRTNK